MQKKIVGIFLCMLMCIPLFAIGATADPKAKFDITGGVGIHITMTNNGSEPLYDIIWCTIESTYLHRWTFMGPGMSTPLASNASMSWRWIPGFKPIIFYIHQSTGIPAICDCTITAKIYDNGGNNTIWGQKSVHARILFGVFVKILS